MRNPAPSNESLARARMLAAVWLVFSVLSVVMLPLVGVVREDDASWRACGLLGVSVFFLAQLFVMWSAVTPWASARLHRGLQASFVGAALLTVPLVAPVGAEHWATWAWLGASVTGTTPLIWRFSTSSLVACATALVSVAVALWTGGDWTQYLLINAGVGLWLALVNWAPVWLWELLLRADASEAAGTRTAAARERNRLSREVHDVLGHDLTVIALKAELAARTAATNPALSAREAEEVRALAESALGRFRGVLAARLERDLDSEIAQMEQTLRAAGLHGDVTTDRVSPSPAASDVLATVVKEATTNILRHSDARHFDLNLESDGARVRLVVGNDRPRPSQSADGSGLHGLRERLAAVEGELVVRRDAERFELMAMVPVCDD